jgi:hypothetical protein
LTIRKLTAACQYNRDAKNESDNRFNISQLSKNLKREKIEKSFIYKLKNNLFKKVSPLIYSILRILSIVRTQK